MMHAASQPVALQLVRAACRTSRPRRAAAVATPLAARRGRCRAFAAAASVLVRREAEAEAAAARAVEELRDRLGDGAAPNLTLWFAKGYGSRAAPVGAIMEEHFGSRTGGVVVGSSSEGGVMADGEEVQNDTFALAAMSLRIPGAKIVPFHSDDLAAPPALEQQVARGDQAPPPCVLAFAALPLPPRANPQRWCSLLDDAAGALTAEAEGARPPAVIGGLSVGHHVFVAGEHHSSGGAFGVIVAPEPGGPSLDAVVCQGAVPFGSRMEITGVLHDHVITQINGQNPRQVLEPLLQGPQVPANGTTMAGVFVDSRPVSPTFASAAPASSAAAALGVGSASTSAPSGRPSCVVRPLHGWTPEGYLVLSPLTDDTPYASGMHFQLHCMNKDLTLEDLRMRVGFDVMAHDGCPPDAAVVISCGARGAQLYGSEGVESGVLRQAWGREVPMLGFFAGGEIGPVGWRTYMHGFTTTCLMVRSPKA